MNAKTKRKSNPHYVMQKNLIERETRFIRKIEHIKINEEAKLQLRKLLNEAILIVVRQNKEKGITRLSKSQRIILRRNFRVVISYLIANKIDLRKVDVDLINKLRICPIWPFC